MLIVTWIKLHMDCWVEWIFFSGKSGKATNKISSFDSYVVAFYFHAIVFMLIKTQVIKLFIAVYCV